MYGKLIVAPWIEGLTLSHAPVCIPHKVVVEDVEEEGYRVVERDRADALLRVSHVLPTWGDVTVFLSARYFPYGVPAEAETRLPLTITFARDSYIDVALDVLERFGLLLALRDRFPGAGIRVHDEDGAWRNVPGIDGVVRHMVEQELDIRQCEIEEVPGKKVSVHAPGGWLAITMRMPAEP